MGACAPTETFVRGCCCGLVYSQMSVSNELQVSPGAMRKQPVWRVQQRHSLKSLLWSALSPLAPPLAAAAKTRPHWRPDVPHAVEPMMSRRAAVRRAARRLRVVLVAFMLIHTPLGLLLVTHQWVAPARPRFAGAVAPSCPTLALTD